MFRPAVSEQQQEPEKFVKPEPSAPPAEPESPVPQIIEKAAEEFKGSDSLNMSDDAGMMDMSASFTSKVR